MHIIIGLGNPGKKYEGTRHNIGFMVVDELARRHGLAWKENKKFKADIAEGPGFILAKPHTFMNNSGETAAAMLRYYHLLPRSVFGIKKDADLTSDLTVVHDDLDLPLGIYKLSANSSSAGHRGVQSVIDRLKTKNFTRLRVGISSNQRRQVPTKAFVLQPLTAPEQSAIAALMDPLIKTIEL